jgi:hypothetical protein
MARLTTSDATNRSNGSRCGCNIRKSEGCRPNVATTGMKAAILPMVLRSVMARVREGVRSRRLVSGIRGQGRQYKNIGSQSGLWACTSTRNKTKSKIK